MSSWNQIYTLDPSSVTSLHISLIHDSIMLLLTFITLMIIYIFISMEMQSLEDLKFSSNEMLEFTWVSAPMITLMMLALPSLHCLYLMEETLDPLVTVKVMGHQWYWSYEYDSTPSIEFDSYMDSMDTDQYRLLETDSSMVLPLEVETRVLVSSTDVIHSFSMPSMGLKMDAVPGRINQTLLTPTKLGKFYGQCSEMCGAMHSFMPIKMEVVPLGPFLSWLSENAYNN
nr:cytochrome c oxidase subunit 2 [Linognathus vituli]